MIRERQSQLHRVLAHFRKKEESYSEIVTRIQNPIPLEDIPDGAPCPACNQPVHKTYLPWGIPANLDERKKLIVTVENAPGYRCSGSCGSTMEWPSNAGLLQVIDQVTPIFQEKGLKKTVHALEWTKQTLLKVIIPQSSPK